MMAHASICTSSGLKNAKGACSGNLLGSNSISKKFDDDTSRFGEIDGGSIVSG
ncbi:hypothetical protein QG37_08001 [Candidozyma auris]|nr:hypothetical protein QG37_08001 [[Candida] auris]